MISAWSPLRLPLYRGLWIAALVSHIGTWTHDVAAAWLMTSLSPSPLLVSLLQTASSLPVFLLALPGGALADIIDRRKLLMFANAWMLAAAALLGVFAWLGLVTPWTLLFFTFLIGIGSALMMPAWQAVTPELVPPAELPQALALGGISVNLSRAVGPALGGFVVAVAGFATAFAVNALSFVAMIAALARWKRVPAVTRLPPESLGGAMRAGLRYVRHAPELRSVLVRTFAFIVSGSALWALLPVVARREMGVGSAGYGLLMGVLGAGAVTGATLLPRVRSAVSLERLVAGATILMALVLVALANVRQFAAVAAVLFVAGLAWISLMTAFNVSAQTVVPAWVRARSLALYQLVFMGGMAIGGAVWGLLATRLGTDVAFMIAGGALVLGLIAALRYGLPARKLDLTPSMHWPVPVAEGEPIDRREPVEITVEYRIDPAQAGAFVKAVEALRSIRLRDGANAWSLTADPGDASHYIETFRVPTWLEHERQHERFSAADREVESVVRALHVGRTPPVVTHRRVTAGAAAAPPP